MRENALENRDIRLFDGIEPQELEEMLVCLKSFTRSYGAGEFILLDQDKVQRVGVVLRGMVHVLKEDPSGHRTLLSYLEPGEIFGQTFALRPETRSYLSFCAAEDAQILFLSLEHVITPCKNNCAFHKRLSANVFRLIGEENLRLVEKLEVCTKANLREKILAYLRLLSRRQGQKYIKVPLNRSDMAAYLQSNRIAMTRELSAMRDEGIIDFDGNTFVLKE